MYFYEFVSCISLKSNRLWLALGNVRWGIGGVGALDCPSASAYQLLTTLLYFSAFVNCISPKSPSLITLHSSYWPLSQLEYSLIPEFRKQRQIRFCYWSQFSIVTFGFSWLVKKGEYSDKKNIWRTIWAENGGMPWDLIKFLSASNPTTRMRNCSFSSFPWHKISGSLFLFPYSLNMVKWISSNLLTLFMTTWIQYNVKKVRFSEFFVFLEHFWICMCHTAWAWRAGRLKPRGSKYLQRKLQLEVRVRRSPRLQVS